MNPVPGDVHFSRPLTNISIAYVQDATAFVADQVFPNIPVEKQADRYWTYDRGHFWRDDMKLRAPATESAGAEYSVDNTPTYYAPVYALHHDIPDEVRANQDDPLNADREATLLITQKAMIKREKLWVSKYFANSLWGTTITGVDSAPSTNQTLRWNDAASDPIADVRLGITTMAESTGLEPNVMVMGRRVWDALQDHPDLVDRIKYGQTPNGPAVTTAQAMAAIFGINRILVMKAVENTAKEGATNSFSFIGGKHCLLAYSTPTPGIMTPTAGYTFSWRGFLGSTDQGFRIKRFRRTAKNADRVEIDMAFDQKLVATELGYFFYTIVA